MDSAQHIKQPRTPGVIFCPDGPQWPVANEDAKLEGELWLNAHHFIFAAGQTIYQELHTNACRVEAQATPPEGKMVTITLHSLRQLSFWFKIGSHADNAVRAIKYLSRPAKITDLFAMQRGGSEADLIPGQGWRLFDERAEWERLGVQMDPACEDKGEFRITAMNKDFKLCPTYPPVLAVPATIEDAVLKVVASYRDGKRLPVLSYLRCHTVTIDGKETLVKTPLMRSAQPLVTSSSKRKYEDEQYLRNVQQIAVSDGKILDTRSTKTIAEHTKKGGGCELIEKYYKWTKIPSDIGTPAQLQDSYDKVLEASLDDTVGMTQYLAKIDPWMSHVRAVLCTAVVTAHQIEHGHVAVLVHGSLGQDNTAAVVSLAQLFLDPHYRSIKGFCQLIEKEWLRMGHPFQSRVGQVGKVNPSLRAPSFLMFLDAVHQVLHQFPPAFEFTEGFLRELHTHTISSDYGTFLYNSLAERVHNKLEVMSNSLWTYLLTDEQRAKFTNPIYVADKYPGYIRVSFKSQALRLWKELFAWHRYDQEATMPRLTAEVQAARQQDLQVTRELQAVMEEIAKLEK
eukprot:TRINITY_DN4434_c0_g1_i2.p1 TRINITY_DN4434_c0_g1~~TRINITY_DN4434_c0_g1_i2.p1  ORF type:complete len:567 (+),score=128.00 TRINITY_DN4434_c0_g1_i2:49-1749(+)